MEEKFVLTQEQRNELKAEAKKLLETYDYNPTDKGLDAIIDEWLTNKNDLLLWMSKHPNYNGKFQIAFDSDYDREWGVKEASDFRDWVQSVKVGAFAGIKLDFPWTQGEMMDILDKITSASNCFRKLYRLGYTQYKAKYDEMRNEYAHFDSLFHEYYFTKDGYDKYVTRNGVFVTREVALAMKFFSEALWRIIDRKLVVLDNAYVLDYIKANLPELKINGGMKVSRFINKFCTYYGINQHPEYNARFAQLADAINPLAITRHTVFSVNPIDYWTMSFGNSWASCHTIDKTNKRNSPNNYHGQYSSGTESYMLDSTSMVVYTVDGKYDGNQLELQDKIYRNMIHISPNKDMFIQGRMYPQANDGATDLYKKFREMEQKIVADFWEKPNLWKYMKKDDANFRHYMTNGTHYEDYRYYEDCGYSFLKQGTEFSESSYGRISIGHDPICPCCGTTHNGDSEAIECVDCYNSVQCACCGEDIDTSEDEYHVIDGEYYCDDCCTYCSWHNAYEVSNNNEYLYDFHGYDAICEDALESDDDFERCHYCGEWFCVEDGIKTEDGEYYCSAYCAERNGYIPIEGNYGDIIWVQKSETTTCPSCGRVVRDSDYDEELGHCAYCDGEEE